MGQCYDVILKINYINERAITNALEEYMNDNKETIDWGLWRYEPRGITSDTLDGAMQIILSDQNFEKVKRGVYTSSFDASYGWEPVLYDMFKKIAPFIKDGSTMDVWMGEGRNVLVAQKGKAKFLDNEEIRAFDNKDLENDRFKDLKDLSRNELILHAVMLSRSVNRNASKEEDITLYSLCSNEELIGYIKSFDEIEESCLDGAVCNEKEIPDDEREAYQYTPSATRGDYSPSNPWDAPGMSVRDFI